MVDDISAECMTIRLRWSISMLIWIVYSFCYIGLFVKLIEGNLKYSKGNTKNNFRKSV